MKQNWQNIAVGFVVLVALAGLAGLVLVFAGLPEIFQSGYTIKMLFPATADAHAGDPIHLAGISTSRWYHAAPAKYLSGCSQNGTLMLPGWR